MPFLVVAGNALGVRGVANYRGTCRESPPHADGLADDAEYNQLFFWYCREDDKPDGVQDLDRARRLLQLLRRDLCRQDFELIETIRLGERPSAGGRLVGYDLSHAWSYSLLSWGLDLHSQGNSPIQDLVALVEAHFKPLLNEHGLFSDEQTAAFCLRSMMALQTLSPGLWEHEESSNFEVVAIYRVPEVESNASSNSTS
jgi:hypothetical protein